MERTHKMILVSIYEGAKLIGWRLAKAVKVGKHYRVLPESRCK